MKEFSVTMALADFIPVILFLIASIVLLRYFYGKLSIGAYACFASGNINVFIAGFLKATYKLLYALNVCDFTVLSDIFMPLQSIGFILMGCGVITYCFKKKDKIYTVVPIFFKGTPLFIIFMCLGLAVNNISLAKLAFSKKKILSGIFFIVNLLCSLCMGYLSTKNFDLAIYNWMAEGVNIFGQLALVIAAIKLSKES